MAAHGNRRHRPPDRQGRLLWGIAERGERHHGLDVHLVGAGNSAGQAALHFASHARSVTLVVRGERLENSMSHYLVAQIAGKSNISVKLGPKCAPSTAKTT